MGIHLESTHHSHRNPAKMTGGWIGFPAAGNLSHDFAIRQFCPARVQQEAAAQVWPHNMFDEMPDPVSSEAEAIVESFFDVDSYELDNASKFDAPNEAFVIGEEGRSSAGDRGLNQWSESFDPCELNNDGDGDHMVIKEERRSLAADRGVNLVHLLLTCAEAVGCRDIRLADTILNQIWSLVDPCGDSLQRVACCFARGLRSRLSFLQIKSTKCLPLTGCVEKFTLLDETTPFFAFGFMAANAAICRVSKSRGTLHIVDIGMEHNLQWSSLVRMLASIVESHGMKLRVTGVIGDQDPSLLETSMKELTIEAGSLGIYLEFDLVLELVSPLSLAREKLKLREGELLIINSVMQLHKHIKESKGSLKSLLHSIKNLNPTLLTVVEQDANHNGPFFLGRFVEALHYYSAVFDSLEAGLPRDSPCRARIEGIHFAEEIVDIVGREGPGRVERHERAEQWRRQLSQAGFEVVGMRWLEEDRVKGFSVENEKGCLHLGWKGRPLMWASAWQLHSYS